MRPHDIVLLGDGTFHRVMKTKDDRVQLLGLGNLWIAIKELTPIVASQETAFPAGTKVKVISPKNADLPPQFVPEMRSYIGTIQTVSPDKHPLWIKLNGFSYHPSWVEAIPDNGVVETRKIINELLESVM